MARAGTLWNDNLCSKCFGTFDRKLDISTWEYFQERRDVIVKQQRDPGRVKAELRRQSKYRDQAKEQGVERPFLLLVSMPPFTRNAIAASLGFALFLEPYFGDPHAESIHILCDSRVGIQARANQSWETLNPLAQNANWCDILVRVMECVFDMDLEHKSYEISQKASTTPGSPLIQDLEEKFIVFLSKRSHLKKEEDSDVVEDHATVKEVAEEQENDVTSSVDTVTEKDRIVARGALSHLTTATEELVQRRKRIEESEQGAKLLQDAMFFSEEAVEIAETEDNESDMNLDDTILHIKKMIQKNTGMDRDEVASYGIQLGMQVAGVNKLSAALLVLRLSAQLIPTLAGVSLPLISLLGVFATPLFVIGCLALAAGAIKLGFGSSEGRLLLPVICILNQRLILAFEDINIDDALAGKL
eukprot:CAMPEP_0206206028 /NCGR_PEP_ID=MMETSP0166-20121206/14632_1 /ASSEMBLY_ACC=CAM_ASM_000260 /TAXON_ID=95228 /ORGANISM="Vannella robusta, Strain DIVA3 518/3/11/1/6" /LENGTH=415 /DNA_ID=CAMNT_0053626281 /DNA_START=571 /DNA_END=1818 /DNA_ORIENTATION=-